MRVRAALAAVGPARRRAALRRFRADPRDHASPAAMARVLVRLWRGELLAPAHAAWWRDELSRCRTGAARLRAGLPPGAAAADRTGACFGGGDDGALCANDVGVVTLPSGEHVVIAAYVEDAGGPVAPKERVPAAIARAVWHHYAIR